MSKWKDERYKTLHEKIGVDCTSLYYSLNGMKNHLEYYFPERRKEIRAHYTALKMLEQMESKLEEVEAQE